MAEANPYIVSFYQRSETTGGCITSTREEWAYSAKDARAQVELLFEGSSDPYFRVTKIEPKREETKV